MQSSIKSLVGSKTLRLNNILKNIIEEDKKSHTLNKITKSLKKLKKNKANASNKQLRNYSN